MPDYKYKSKIEEAVSTHTSKYKKPQNGPREYPLQDRCRADFCYEIIPSGRLFIEDDDGARGLANLIKYWIFCEENQNIRPVHVIHIIETSKPASIRSIRFLSEKMKYQINGFHYHMIELQNWQVQDEIWLPELRKILSGI